MKSSLFLILACLASVTLAAEPVRFPFVVDGLEHEPSVTDRRVLNTAPAGQHGFISIRDGHFVEPDADGNTQRIRFWGMNMCFPANFPSHDVADDLAPHLAKLGVNAVRFHHADMQDFPSGIWGGYQDQRRIFSDEAVDRLDYFLARLADAGIYADLNLHVSRTLGPKEGYPELKDVPWWADFNKWVMYYDRDVQSELKRYCRELLTHENPYRGGLRRVDDPAIGLVEMLNENYFTVQGYALYQKLPQRYQDSFIAAWNAWLKEQYGDTDAMLRSWQQRQPSAGGPVVAPETFQLTSNRWRILSNRDSVAVTEVREDAGEGDGDDAAALRFEPSKAFDQDHRLQFGCQNLSVEEGSPMTIRFRVRADRERSFHVELSSSAGGEWRDVGLYQALTATPDWTEVTRTVVPGESIENQVNFVFSFGDDVTPIEFDDVGLIRGTAAASLPDDQTIEDASVAIPGDTSFVAAHIDMKRFMADTEVAWVAELKSFLVDELGVKVPITASQINYHVPEVHETQNDFVDLHNYWHHPLFPSGGNWDPNRWTVGNEPMAIDPQRSKWPTNSLLMRTGWRYQGKPFTCSEWNYPEPSPYSAGCVPMAAMVAALQDWDGVFFFQYDSESKTREDWQRDHTTSFFSFNGQPVKLATFALFANVFRRGDLRPLGSEAIAPVDDPLDGLLALQHRLAVSPQVRQKPSLALPDPRNLTSSDDQIRWQSDPEATPPTGVIRIDTDSTAGMWGTIGGQSARLDAASFVCDPLQPNYGLLLASSMDGQPIDQSQQIVVLAATHSENQEMGWNADRDSVGTEWGHGPTTVMGMSAEATIRCDIKNPVVHSLDGNGRFNAIVESEWSDGSIQFQIRPEHQTLWYAVTAGE